MNTVKIQHFGHNDHQLTGSFTIATVMTDELITYGVAFCSTKDKFVKKIGTELATKRTAESGDWSGIAVVPPLATRTEILTAVLAAIVASNQMPDWARPLVLEHLFDYSLVAQDIALDLHTTRKKLVHSK